MAGEPAPPKDPVQGLPVLLVLTRLRGSDLREESFDVLKAHKG